MEDEKISKAIWLLKNSIENAREALVIIISLREKFTCTKEDRDSLFIKNLYLGLINTINLCLANFYKDNENSINYFYLVNCIKNIHPPLPDIEYRNLFTVLDNLQSRLNAKTFMFDYIFQVRDTTIAHLDRRHINNPRALEILNRPYWEELIELIEVIGEGLDYIGVFFGLERTLPDMKMTNKSLTSETERVFDTIYKPTNLQTRA